MTGDLIGVDAGGTWIKAARFAGDFAKEEEVKIPSGAAEGVETYFDAVAQAIQQCTKDPATAQVGLSLPAVFSKDRETIRYAANIAGLDIGGAGLRVREALSSRLATQQVVAENDAKCAALAEWARGWGKGNPATYLLHITWGTGIGTGFVSGGEVQYGWEGGHIPVAWEGSSALGCDDVCQCGCGSTIDLESHIAVPRLVERAQVLLDGDRFQTEITEDILTDPREATKHLNRLAEAGDELAQALLRDALLWLARGLHNMAIIAYPDIVTVGGAMMSVDWLLDELRQAVEKSAQGFLRDTLKPEMVQRSSLGNDAGMIGAAALAKTRFS